MVKAIPSRVDSELSELIKKIRRQHEMSGLGSPSDRRISKAIARAVKQYPNVYQKLIESPLEDDRNFMRGIRINCKGRGRR